MILFILLQTELPEFTGSYMKFILSCLGILLSAGFASWIREKKIKKEFDVKEDLQKEKYSQLETNSEKQERRLKAIEEAHLFDKEFRNIILKIATLKINNNSTFRKSKYFRKAIKDFAKDLAEEGVYYNICELRKAKDVTENDLELAIKEDLDSILYDFLDLIFIGIKDERVFEVNNKLYSVTLTSYLILIEEKTKEPGITKLTGLLVERLKQNGFKENDISLRDAFKNHFDKFMIEFSKRVDEFYGLEDYEKKISKIID